MKQKKYLLVTILEDGTKVWIDRNGVKYYTRSKDLV